MPVVRGQARGPSLADEQRKVLLEILQKELSGNSPQGGAIVSEIPLIFEIPLERIDGMSDRIDVLVVWDAFESLPSEERSALILDAYQDQAARISQALAVTRVEAMEQSLLPYRIVHRERPGEADPKEVSKAMLDEGGFPIGNKVNLFLPTRRMAEAALGRLYERVPKGDWAIGEVIAR